MISQFGLSEETMLKILNKNVNQNPNSEVYMSFFINTLIPNIVEVIAANNEALLFNLETERTKEDSGK
jgi:hypothetical protein